MTSEDFAELQAEELLDPTGEWRADCRAFNSWRLQHAKQAGVADWAPEHRLPQAQTPEQMIEAVKGWTVFLGGTIEH